MEKLNLKYSAQQPAQGMRTFYHNNLHGIFPFQVCKPYYAAGAGNVTRQRGSKSQDHGRFGSKVQLQVR